MQTLTWFSEPSGEAQALLYQEQAQVPAVPGTGTGTAVAGTGTGTAVQAQAQALTWLVSRPERHRASQVLARLGNPGNWPGWRGGAEES